MGRPKSSEETTPFHTRLTTSQREAFEEYMRREQSRMPRGTQITEAAVLRGMVLRCLDLEGIPYVGAQQPLFPSPPPVVEEPAPPPPPPVIEEPPAPSSPAEVTSEATTEIAEPVKTAAKAKKGATTTSTKSAPAKKPKKSTAPAKKPKKGAR